MVENVSPPWHTHTHTPSIQTSRGWKWLKREFLLADDINDGMVNRINERKGQRHLADDSRTKHSGFYVYLSFGYTLPWYILPSCAHTHRERDAQYIPHHTMWTTNGYHKKYIFSFIHLMHVHKCVFVFLLLYIV